jgi:hypothetical protein
MKELGMKRLDLRIICELRLVVCTSLAVKIKQLRFIVDKTHTNRSPPLLQDVIVQLDEWRQPEQARSGGWINCVVFSCHPTCWSALPM